MQVLDKVRLSIEDMTDELTTLVQRLVEQELSHLREKYPIAFGRSSESTNSVSDGTSSVAEIQQSQPHDADAVTNADGEQLAADRNQDQEEVIDTDESATAPEIEEQQPTEIEALLDCVGELQVAVEDISREQARLTQLFQSRIHSDEVQASVFDRLHEELRSYKQNFIRQEIQPLLKDIIFCYDHAEKLKAGLVQSTGEDAPLTQAASIQSQMLLDVLFKHEVEPIRGESNQFDRKQQQCVQSVATDDASLEKTIAQRSLCGFVQGNQILRREQVSIYRHEGVTSEQPVSSSDI